VDEPYHATLSPPEKERLASDMLAYGKRDTEVVVEILKVLRKVAEIRDS
jgi:hypothetical protein